MKTSLYVLLLTASLSNQMQAMEILTYFLGNLTEITPSDAEKLMPCLKSITKKNRMQFIVNDKEIEKTLKKDLQTYAHLVHEKKKLDSESTEKLRILRAKERDEDLSDLYADDSEYDYDPALDGDLEDEMYIDSISTINRISTITMRPHKSEEEMIKDMKAFAQTYIELNG